MVLRNVIIYRRIKFHLPKSSGSLSSKVEILTKHLYCRHLVTYHSLNIAAAITPPPNTTQNSGICKWVLLTNVCVYMFVCFRST
jgi:hypothetical protein